MNTVEKEELLAKKQQLFALLQEQSCTYSRNNPLKDESIERIVTNITTLVKEININGNQNSSLAYAYKEITEYTQRGQRGYSLTLKYAKKALEYAIRANINENLHEFYYLLSICYDDLDDIPSQIKAWENTLYYITIFYGKNSDKYIEFLNSISSYWLPSFHFDHSKQLINYIAIIEKFIDGLKYSKKLKEFYENIAYLYNVKYKVTKNEIDKDNAIKYINLSKRL